MKRMEGKVALITGGASGIGEASVRRFIEEGARVLFVDLQEERGKKLAGELGDAARFCRVDVSREDEVSAAVDLAVTEFGHLDCMFNNAGFGGTSGPIADLPVEEYDFTMGILLRGVYLGMKHASRVMTPQGSGSIISTASVAGLSTGFGPHIYSAAKAAVIHLTRSVAMELGEQGVRVNCICPGGIATPLIANALGGGEAALETARQFMGALQPIQRAGLPEDIAQAALFLAGDEAGFVSGHALVVDGGLGGGRLWSSRPEAMRVHQPMRLPGE